MSLKINIIMAYVYEPPVPHPKTLHKAGVHRVLNHLYTDPASPLAFTGLQAFVRAVEKQYGIPKRMTSGWLQEQRVYTKQRQSIKKPKTRRDPTYVTGINELWQADLLDMTGQSGMKQNKGVRFLLTVIDVLSRRAYVRPLQRKTPDQVKTAFESIVDEAGVVPVALHTDRGKEFYNKIMKPWLEKKGIHHYSTFSENKAALVEGFNRTLKQTIVDYWIHTRQTNYVNRLPDFVKAYNAREHRAN